jgi:hypothetical protein
MKPCKVCEADDRTPAGRCRPCLRKQRLRYKVKYPTRSREQDKESRQRRKDKVYSVNEAYKKANRDKTKMHSRIFRAVHSGKITKTIHCQLCWDLEVELHGHHEDYGEPLEVIWLCRMCHRIVHLQKTVGASSQPATEHREPATGSVRLVPHSSNKEK